MYLHRFDINNDVETDFYGMNENFALLENKVTGRRLIYVSGKGSVTLTKEEASNTQLVFYGSLTGNVSIIFPNTPSVYVVQNRTVGNYTLTLKTRAGSGVIIQQANLPNHPRIKRVLCDGTDITWADGNQIVEDNLHEETPTQGCYVRFANGVQECWHEVNITYVTASSLYTTWVFPQPFLTEPDVQLTLISHLLRGSISGGTFALHSLFIRQISNTQVRPQAQSASGSSWAETDSLYVKCRAIGRWK